MESVSEKGQKSWMSERAGGRTSGGPGVGCRNRCDKNKYNREKGRQRTGDKQRNTKRDEAQRQRREIKPRKPQGDLITRLPIDLLSCDVEITSRNQ